MLDSTFKSGGRQVTDNNMIIEKWSTLKEVQEYLGVGRETILQWIAKRNMPAYKVGRLWKFKLSEVDAWIRSGGAADDNSKEDEE
jgi:excisionase family DNA binding protein